jgi:hypothetical protein
VLTLNTASLVCLAGWGVTKLVWLPLRLRLVRVALTAQRA